MPVKEEESNPLNCFFKKADNVVNDLQNQFIASIV